MATTKTHKYVHRRIVISGIGQYALGDANVSNNNFFAMEIEELEQRIKTNVMKIPMKERKCAWNIAKSTTFNLSVLTDMALPCVQIVLFAPYMAKQLQRLNFFVFYGNAL